MLSFEVLDQGKTANKSNKTKNPNVQKIANHQPLSELFGLVAVKKKEKVVLDRIQEKNGQISMYDESDDEKDRQANELRNLIGKLPALAIFIDEVHHAVSDEIKLRAVVNRWTEGGTVNSVIGFSGTPYLEKAEKFIVTDTLTVGTAVITNTVYYYPLVDGVGNFLKRPVVKISDVSDSGRIIENGVREFLNLYKDTMYQNGTAAKLGIYCGTIEKLEELVYPLVSRIAGEYGLSTDCILKFHKGNRQYPQPADSQMQFDTLDHPISKIRIILLVQIGKEGWDCRSLTGVILSQEGDCPKNMVLQTSCRCLRQVDRGLPDGSTRISITNGEQTYLWYGYGGDAEVVILPAGEFSADAEQSIPTYEDILDLPVEEIALADYRPLDVLTCIYVETTADPAGYATRYWVSVENGLLVQAERLLGEEAVYRMTSLYVDETEYDASRFTLPDGTVLLEEE